MVNVIILVPVALSVAVFAYCVHRFDPAARLPVDDGTAAHHRDRRHR